MGFYDTLDTTTKALADTLVETKKLDPEIAAICAKAGEGSADVFLGAIDAAKKHAGGKQDPAVQNAARIKEINEQLEALDTQYKTAAEKNQYATLVGIKNRANALRIELNALQNKK